MENTKGSVKKHDRFKLQRHDNPFKKVMELHPGWLDKCEKCQTVLPNRCAYCSKCLTCFPGATNDRCGECDLIQERLTEIKKDLQILCRQLADLGKDVCIECCTNNPKRCLCGKCLNCYEEVEGKCEECYLEQERIRKAKQAESEGKDVCPNCYTIEPDRCHCGNCLTCHSGSYGECDQCDCDSSDDD